MKTVTNSNVDTLAAAVPSPYGPIVRVTDFEELPEPNSGIRGQFTSALSVTVWISPEDLENPIAATKIIREQHNTPGVMTPVVADMIIAIDELNDLASAMSTPHTYEDYETLRDFAVANLPWMAGAVTTGWDGSTA